MNDASRRPGGPFAVAALLLPFIAYYQARLVLAHMLAQDTGEDPFYGPLLLLRTAAIMGILCGGFSLYRRHRWTVLAILAIAVNAALLFSARWLLTSHP